MTTQSRNTTCPLDCPDACALQVDIQGDRLLKLRGNPEHPYTKGFACVKMYAYPQRQHHPDRLLYPQKRVADKGRGVFERITWEEALDTIATKVQGIVAEHGAEAVLPYSYAGTMGLIEQQHPLTFFRTLGASVLDWTICAATGKAAWQANYGPQLLSTDPEDVAQSKCIVLWGIDSVRSHLHLSPPIKAAKKAGAKVIHVDPFRNETSQLASEHVQPKVGTDTALALALGKLIIDADAFDKDFVARYARGFEEYRQACAAWPLDRAAAFCELPEADIQNLANALVEHPNSYIRVGYGMTRNESGGNALRAVTLLAALLGSWKHLGGGAGMTTSGAFPLNYGHFSGNHLLTGQERVINMNQLASALELRERPVKSLFVFNSNPAAVAPDSSRVLQGLARPDLFTVVMEHFQTDTADYADILLPATTFLEHPDLYTSYGHYYIQWADGVLAAQGEAKSNRWVFEQLARRLGLSEERLYWSAEEIARDLLNSDHPFLEGISFDKLQGQSYLKMKLPKDFRPYANGSSFADKQFRFAPVPQQLTFQEQPNTDYPLRLISPPGKHMVNTSMGNIDSLLQASGGEPLVLIHPKDGERLEIPDQAHCHVYSVQGSIVRKVGRSEDVKEGTAVALGQWWPKLAPDRKSLNQLSSERLTDYGGGSSFGNVLVNIVPAD